MSLKKFITDFAVEKNERLNSDTFLLVLKHPDVLPPMMPGQFAEVLVEDEPSVFLRRPLSLHDADYENNTLSLFVKIVGKGTARLSQLQAGAILNLVYPLGNSFTILKNAKVLLAGGGCGVAPLMYLAKELQKAGNEVHMLLGARSSCDILLVQEYSRYGKVHITTDDGSTGEKGLLIQHPVIRHDVSAFDMVYTCGPERMMLAVARLAVNAGVACEVSLENTMACGIGACLCCVVKTTAGHQCVCTDGPVFNVKNLTWQI